MQQRLLVLGNGPLAEAIRFGTKDLTNYPRTEDIPTAQIVWWAHDTPINAEGVIEYDIRDDLRNTLGFAKTGATVLLSSQLPVGTCAALEKEFAGLRFVVVPENIRVGHNIQDWLHQPRIIVGYRTTTHLPPEIMGLISKFTKQIIVMTPESAEMVKHALNGFLALSVTYSHEVGQLCLQQGADPVQVAQGLMSDPRIGEGAYLFPGGPYGQHLAREINNLIALGGGQLIQSIKASNDKHTREAT